MLSWIKYIIAAFKLLLKVGFNLKQVFVIFIICIVACGIFEYFSYYVFYLKAIEDVINEAPQSQQDFMTRRKVDDLVLDEYIPNCGNAFYWSITRIYADNTDGEYFYTAQLQRLYGYKGLSRFFISFGSPEDLLTSREPKTQEYMAMYRNPAPINDKAIDKIVRLQDDEFIKLESKTITEWDIEPLKTFVKKRNEAFKEDIWGYTILAVIRSPVAVKLNQAPAFLMIKQKFPIIIIVAVTKLNKGSVECDNDTLLNYLTEMTNTIRTGALSGLHSINSFKFIDTTDQIQRDNFLQRR